MSVLYEDEFCIAVCKPQGIASEDGEGDCLPARLRTYLAQGGADAEVYPVHRLDRPTGGAILYAKTKESTAFLSSAVADRRVGKRYLAVLVGTPTESSGTLSDYLYHDKRQNKVFVVKHGRKGAKEAILDYCVLGARREDENELSLVSVTLRTGRTHQIRAQFSSRRIPVYGDRRYGSKVGLAGGRIALWSHELTFPLLGGGMQTVVSELPNEFPWNLFVKTELIEVEEEDNVSDD